MTKEAAEELAKLIESTVAAKEMLNQIFSTMIGTKELHADLVTALMKLKTEE